jgi:hypothetical protein
LAAPAPGDRIERMSKPAILGLCEFLDRAVQTER